MGPALMGDVYAPERASSVLILGLGGTGKTRLGYELAQATRACLAAAPDQPAVAVLYSHITLKTAHRLDDTMRAALLAGDTALRGAAESAATTLLTRRLAEQLLHALCPSAMSAGATLAPDVTLGDVVEALHAFAVKAASAKNCQPPRKVVLCLHLDDVEGLSMELPLIHGALAEHNRAHFSSAPICLVATGRSLAGPRPAADPARILPPVTATLGFLDPSDAAQQQLLWRIARGAALHTPSYRSVVLPERLADADWPWLALLRGTAGWLQAAVQYGATYAKSRPKEWLTIELQAQEALTAHYPVSLWIEAAGSEMAARKLLALALAPHPVSPLEHLNGEHPPPAPADGGAAASVRVNTIDDLCQAGLLHLVGRDGPEDPAPRRIRLSRPILAALNARLGLVPAETLSMFRDFHGDIQETVQLCSLMTSYLAASLIRHNPPPLTLRGLRPQALVLGALDQDDHVMDRLLQPCLLEDGPLVCSPSAVIEQHRASGGLFARSHKGLDAEARFPWADGSGLLIVQMQTKGHVVAGNPAPMPYSDVASYVALMEETAHVPNGVVLELLTTMRISPFKDAQRDALSHRRLVLIDSLRLDGSVGEVWLGKMLILEEYFKSLAGKQWLASEAAELASDKAKRIQPLSAAKLAAKARGAAQR